MTVFAKYRDHFADICIITSQTSGLQRFFLTEAYVLQFGRVLPTLLGLNQRNHMTPFLNNCIS